MKKNLEANLQREDLTLEEDLRVRCQMLREFIKKGVTSSPDLSHGSSFQKTKTSKQKISEKIVHVFPFLQSC